MDGFEGEEGGRGRPAASAGQPGAALGGARGKGPSPLLETGARCGLPREEVKGVFLQRRAPLPPPRRPNSESFPDKPFLFSALRARGAPEPGGEVGTEPSVCRGL